MKIVEIGKKNTGWNASYFNHCDLNPIERITNMKPNKWIDF